MSLDKQLYSVFCVPPALLCGQGSNRADAEAHQARLASLLGPLIAASLAPDLSVYHARLHKIAAAYGCTPAVVEDAASRDPGGIAAVEDRVMRGGPLEYSPGWYFDLMLQQPIPSAWSLARERMFGKVPMRKGRPIYQAHTRTHWGQHK